MSARVFVTGVGIITAIGDNLEENLTSIKSGVSGLGTITHIDTQLKDSYPVCEIEHNNDALKKIAGITGSGPFSRTALLGSIAAGEAVDSAELSEQDLKNCALISANSVGGMDLSEAFYPLFLQNRSAGKLRNVYQHECGYSTRFMADRLNVGGLITTVSTACSSSANSIMFGARLIKSGQVETAIVGGCDALTRFTLNGFASLKILDIEGCRPFDAARSGLNLGEGAGYLVIQSEARVVKGKKQPICEITGYANTCDAFHQTASSSTGEGAYLAMSGALKSAGISPERIDYLNAHGTGTDNNDLSESIAIERVFNQKLPPLSSTKPFTGHTLGAAGGIEAVLCAISIRDGIRYPNLRWQTPMNETRIRPITRFQTNETVDHVLSNSFGFGGNDTSLVFSRS